MNFALYALILHLTIVFITDYTDAPRLAKKCLIWVLSRGRAYTDKYDAKLLECSLCQCWWLTWILVIGWMIAYGWNGWLLIAPMISAFAAKQTAQLLFAIDDFCTSVFKQINKMIKHISQ